MKKNDSTRKLAIIPVVIVIFTIVVFINYYFVKPISKLNEKTEVSTEEKFELDLLTIAYLSQNKGSSINTFLLHDAANQKYAVAADYYYLKNGKDHLNEYEKILDLARLIFDDKKVEVSNFTINIDKDRCGKEKYSTIEGIINSDTCDLEESLYEIVTTYYQNSEYVVEFYASTAIQERIDSIETCQNFEKPISYSLKLLDLERKEYYNENEFKCCLDDCKLEGIDPLKVKLISQVKSEGKLYKLTFIKKDDHFVFSKINKV